MLSQILCYFRFWFFYMLLTLSVNQMVHFSKFLWCFLLLSLTSQHFSLSPFHLLSLLSSAPPKGSPLLHASHCPPAFQVPGGGGDNNSTTGSTVGVGVTFADGGGLWGEEDTELIRSCGALSSALGLQKSFSTSDIVGATGTGDEPSTALRSWTSEVRGGGVSLCRELAVQEMTQNWLVVGPWWWLSFPIYYALVFHSSLNLVCGYNTFLLVP